MSDLKLIRLYRRFTRGNGGSAKPPDIEALLSANAAAANQSNDVLNELGSNGLHADLLHFSRELGGASAALGADVSALLNGESAGSHSRYRSSPARQATRRAIGPRQRWLRSLTGVAAILVAGVVFFSAQHRADRAPTAQPSEDRIFAALNETSDSRKPDDKIFHDDFRSDTIFSASFKGG